MSEIIQVLDFGNGKTIVVSADEDYIRRRIKAEHNLMIKENGGTK